MSQVCLEVFDTFEADGEAHQVGGDTCRALLLLGELTVRRAAGVDDEGLRVAEVSHDAEDLRIIDEALSSFIAVLQTKGDDTAEASLEVAVADLMMLI